MMTWLFTVEDARDHGDVFTSLVTLLPVALFLVAVKRPDRASLDFAADAFAWSALALTLGTLVLQLNDASLGVVTELSSMERGMYWLPLADVLGFAGRWAGPFGHPNIASPVGVFLIVYGLVRPGLRRISFVATAVLILALTGTRSSMIAAVAGVVVVIALDRRLARGRVPGRYLAAAGVLGFAALTAVLVGRNTGLTGRTSIWPEYVALWRDSPFTGIGDPGIGVAIEQGQLPAWAVHGHNVVLDAMTRYGVIAAALVIAVLVLAGWITARAAARGNGVGLALLTTLVVGGLTETLFDWRYLTFTVVILLLSVLLSADEVPAVRDADPLPAAALIT